jgi:hypothetical protein
VVHEEIVREDALALASAGKIVVALLLFLNKHISGGLK